MHLGYGELDSSSYQFVADEYDALFADKDSIIG